MSRPPRFDALRRLGGLTAIALVCTGATPATGTSGFEPAVLDSIAGAVRAEVEEIRGHDFTHEVPVRVVDDAALRRYVIERIDEVLPAERIRDEAAVYADLGLIDRDLDVLDAMLDALEEQVAGFYDPQEDVVFLLDDQPVAAIPVLLAHELTHALDDQVFDLERSLRAMSSESDAAVAQSGAREGSGTVVMTIYLTRQTMNGGFDLQGLRDVIAQEDRQRAVLDSLPPVLARSLLAPYVLGSSFVLRGRMDRMWSPRVPADLDTVLTRLPESTEQLLHPAKYWSEDHYDAPRTIRLPDLSAVAGPQWQRVAEGTVGELDTACLTGICDAEPATPSGWTNEGAAGWDGDRWQLLRAGERTITVWALVWDSPQDAAEFEASVALPEGARISAEGELTVIVAGDAGPRAAALLKAARSGLSVSDDGAR